MEQKRRHPDWTIYDLSGRHMQRFWRWSLEIYGERERDRQRQRQRGRKGGKERWREMEEGRERDEGRERETDRQRKGGRKEMKERRRN